MECIFLNSAMVCRFVRDDMEAGNWTQEEYSVNMTFPYDNHKVIQRGQRVAFRDPATNNLEIFEIRNVNNIEPEHYQQIIGEHIVISELSDEHINTTQIADKTPAQALTTALTGTLWSVGNVTATNVSSCDFSRGNVWQAIQVIQSNWNVYITPRVTLNAEGTWITGRYLDIAPAQGTWRGVRLSIEKNMLDSSVVYDDSDIVTALYGYGGNIEVQNPSDFNTTTELTFADVVWTATDEHPAKPSGQTYLEDPAKTALYGRGGRPRYGYYQNSDIKDANLLLQKTWETLKQSSDPKISISGMVTDLYRLGYHDEPLRLHDIAIVEIRETGEKFEKEIIRLDVDLIDPTATRPEIGDYIPNIIYINRDTEKKSSGGGGGGGRGQTNEEKKTYDTFYDLSADTTELGSWVSMVVGKVSGDKYIKGGEITLAINADHGTTATLKADTIDIDGLVLALVAYDITVESLTTTNTATFGGDVSMPGLTITDGGDINGFTNLIGDYGTFDDIETTSITLGNTSHNASWKSATATKINCGPTYRFVDNQGGDHEGHLVTSYNDVTVHYVGY